jgi:PAS domain S-box-containing protein
MRFGDIQGLIRELQGRQIELELQNENLRRAQEELEASRDNYRDLYENAPNPYFSVNADDGSILTCNSAVLELLGYDKKTITGMKVLDLYAHTPDGVSKAQAVFDRFKAGESIRDVELQMQHKNGLPIWVSLSVEPVKDSAGNITESRSIMVNISDRKKAEEALRGREASYRLLFSAESDAIIILDAATKQIVDVNEAALALYGYSREEFLQLSALEISAEPEKSTAHIEEVVSGKLDVVSPGPVQRLHKKKDGTIFPVEISSGVYVLQDRKMVCAIIRDTTSRMRAEEALRESEEKYRGFFDNAQVGLFRSRISDGKILECNERIAQMFAYKNREQFIAEFVSSEHYLDPGTRERMLAEIRNTGEVTNFEARLSRREGSTIWVRYSARIYPEKGYLEGVATDITEEREATEALRDSQERYLRITDAVTDYIYTVRIHNQHPVETIHGPACVAVTGYTAEDFQVNPHLWMQMVHEEDRNAVEEQARQTLSGVHVEPLEHRIVRKDGAVRWVKNTPVPNFDGQGRLLSYDGLIQDITERKEAEEALRKVNEKLYSLSQELESKVQERTAELKEKSERLVEAERLTAVGKLADRVAHELRNSLTVVGGFARRMNEQTSDHDPNKKYLRIIAGEVMVLEEKLSEIIKVGTS